MQGYENSEGIATWKSEYTNKPGTRAWFPQEYSRRNRKVYGYSHAEDGNFSPTINLYMMRMSILHEYTTNFAVRLLVECCRPLASTKFGSSAPAQTDAILLLLALRTRTSFSLLRYFDLFSALFCLFCGLFCYYVCVSIWWLLCKTFNNVCWRFFA